MSMYSEGSSVNVVQLTGLVNAQGDDFPGRALGKHPFMEIVLAFVGMGPP